MGVNDRLNDISKRCGLSVDIVRAVIKAETDSIAESLTKCERATLIGRVTLKPEVRTRMCIGGALMDFIKVKATISSVLADSVNNAARASGIISGGKQLSDSTEMEAEKQMEAKRLTESLERQIGKLVCRQIPSLVE